MKNIQRFKLPVVVAAGLHGALFLSVPALPGLLTFDVPAPVFLPSVPVERLVPLSDDDPPENVQRVRPLGGPARPELPENLRMTTTDPLFTVPVVSVSRTACLDVELVKAPGISGEIGTEWSGVSVSGSPVIDSRLLDRVPRATVQPSPDYPAGLRRDGKMGSVTIVFTVDAAGQVVRAEALRYSHRELVEPTIKAVLKWRFEPGRRNGKAVPFSLAVPVEFTPPESF